MKPIRKQAMSDATIGAHIVTGQTASDLRTLQVATGHMLQEPHVLQEPQQ